MKLAITGGAGFLGYHLCNRLSHKYDEIFLLDIAPIDTEEYPANIKYFNADVRNLEQIDSILKKGIDIIIHAAAALPLWKKRDIFDININGTRAVLEAALNNNIAKVIYISSTAVYGIPKTHPLYEDSPLKGVGPYGESKIEAEKICREYQKNGMCVPIIRPKSFIGTGRLGVFQILYDWVENGKKIPIIGKGSNRYQLLEVEDLVDAIYLLMTASAAKAGDIFNIGAEKFGTVHEDLNALCAFARTGATVMPTPAWLVKPLLSLFEKARISPLYKWIYDTADKDSYVSTEKLNHVLGWVSKYNNAEALINSYKWYLKNKDELTGTGISHRIAWKQGILAVIKKFL